MVGKKIKTGEAGLEVGVEAIGMKETIQGMSVRRGIWQGGSSGKEQREGVKDDGPVKGAGKEK